MYELADILVVAFVFAAGVIYGAYTEREKFKRVAEEFMDQIEDSPTSASGDMVEND